MADRSIIFSGPMVRALLAGRKTQTRRVIKPTSAMGGLTMYPQYLNGERIGCSSDPSFCDLSEFAVDPSKGLYSSGTPHCPGDRLWVKETFTYGADTYGGEPWPIYGANYSGAGDGAYRLFKPWTSSLYMPRKFSRLTLIVTDVRVQRLQEISEEDARAEGCYRQDEANPCAKPGIKGFYHTWQEINAKRGYGWYENPWVCALTFTVHQQNIDTLAEAA